MILEIIKNYENETIIAFYCTFDFLNLLQMNMHYMQIMNNKQTIYMTLWNVAWTDLVRDKKGRGVRETDMYE